MVDVMNMDPEKDPIQENTMASNATSPSLETAPNEIEETVMDDEETPKKSRDIDYDRAVGGVDPESGKEPTYKGQDAYWYVIYTYSGYENKVKSTLEQIIENRGIHDYIQDIYIPTEDVVEVKDGKKRVVQRKLYPGYVMIKMVLTDEIWYIVRNTRGVSGFVGPNSKPVPLSDEELAIMGMESDWVPVVDYSEGDPVKIIHGPLESFVGIVENISHEKKKVRVLVSMFGRETPVDLEFTQVVKMS